MATFPSLEPDDRSYRPGAAQVDVAGVRSGSEYRVKRSAAIDGDRLVLTFQDRPAADVGLIVAHYIGQGGGLIGFPLSAAAVAGYGVEALASTAALWHYVDEPEIEDRSGELQTVTVTLEAFI